MTASTAPLARADRFPVGGLEYEWNIEQGTMNMSGFAVTTMFRDTSLASLLLGFQAMVGTKRFALALQAEGRKGVDGDWSVIASKPTFEEGFAQLALYAAAAGWGRWEIVKVDHQQKVGQFRIYNSWEGAVQKALGVAWGSGLVMGKFAAFCTRLFGVNCWTEQTKSIAAGDDWDEFVVTPSSRNVAEELEILTAADQATSADLANALRQLKETSAERQRALDERDRMVQELQEKLSVIARQQDAIQALSTPIIQIWEGVLAVPVVGIIDSARAASMTEKLFASIVHTKSRFAIVDVTGVDTIDTATADHFIRLVRGVRLLGARGVISGISPLVAQTIINLGVDLGGVASYSNLQEALRACIEAMAQGPSK